MAYKSLNFKTIAITGLSLAAPLLNIAGMASKKPNVMFILADDMRPDCISALGNPNIRTPNLDKLVERGMAFTHMYVQGANTAAVCLPSRAMILTGRSVFHLGKYPAGPGGFAKTNQRHDNALWANTMKAGGYETYHLGKPGNSYEPGMKAFDSCLYTINRNSETVSEQTADRIIRFIKERKSDKPFFVYMAPAVPHDPRVAPKEFMDMYDPAKIPLPPSFLPFHPFNNGDMTIRDETLAPWPRTESVVKRHLADAYASITCFDHHIGRIVNVLRELGQLDNTIIVFAGDNGLSLGDHGLMGKQNLYEFGGMHVPFVIAGPGIQNGKSDALAYLFDVYPTICELTGIPVPLEIESKSLAPVIRGEVTKVRDYAFTAYLYCQRSARDARWKIIRYPLVDRTQLFDLQNDPHEMDDLFNKPEYADKLREMWNLLEKQQKIYDDDAPLKVVNPEPSEWTLPSPENKRSKNNETSK